MHLMNGFEYTDGRLLVPVTGRYGYVYLIVICLFVFYLFYPSPSNYVPSAHLEGGEPWAQYYRKGHGTFFIICSIHTFAKSYVPCCCVAQTFRTKRWWEFIPLIGLIVKVIPLKFNLNMDSRINRLSPRLVHREHWLFILMYEYKQCWRVPTSGWYVKNSQLVFTVRRLQKRNTETIFRRYFGLKNRLSTEATNEKIAQGLARSLSSGTRDDSH